MQYFVYMPFLSYFCYIFCSSLVYLLVLFFIQINKKYFPKDKELDVLLHLNLINFLSIIIVIFIFNKYNQRIINKIINLWTIIKTKKNYLL